MSVNIVQSISIICFIFTHIHYMAAYLHLHTGSCKILKRRNAGGQQVLVSAIVSSRLSTSGGGGGGGELIPVTDCAWPKAVFLFITHCGVIKRLLESSVMFPYSRSKTQVTFHRSLVADHCFTFFIVTQNLQFGKP